VAPGFLPRSLYRAVSERKSEEKVKKWGDKLFTDTFNSKPPPDYRGIPIKFFFPTQVATNPPTFAVFVNHPERLRFNYKKYLSGESVVDMSDGTSLQCPLYFKYTSTESGHINNLHNGAMYMGRLKKITNFEDEFCAPWRTNGKAYINWCVGPKEAQQKHKGKTSLVFKL
jgi:hypothetical protein